MFSVRMFQRVPGDFAFKNCFVITFLILFESIFIDAKNRERIQSGYTTQNNELAKYIVSLRDHPEIVEFGDGHFCGGSILKPNIIVTAAHCLVNDNRQPEKILVVAGAVNRIMKDKTTQTRKVIKYKAHPQYNIRTTDYDIALLLLEKSLKEDGVRVQRVNLNTKPPTAGKTCIVMGWGDIYAGGPMADTIMYANKTIMLYKSCKRLYEGKYPQGVICLYNRNGGTTDSCEGDSGGPFICDGNTLVGIVSHGEEHCKGTSPEIHTDVRRFVNFIKKTEETFRSSCKSLETLLTLISLSICGVFLNYLQIF